ncbi:hypothetical protein VMCG_04808 [Cytospora schulzeri]|uniref:Long-chain-alcohol oxidase n=1 Tax=Cytospora schulzeri TaxID=448051 RepID=A0A423WN25_9PEZI|nr:hypothetical protein VMCG_04808 [Valsa malicola]
MGAILPSIQRESTAPRRKSLSKAYISDTQYQEAVSHLRSNTVVLDSASEQDLDKYLSERPIDDLLFQQMLKGMLHYLPPDTRSTLFRVLYILSTQAGALLLTGYTTPMTRLSIEDRTKVLHKWANSYVYQLRGLSGQLTTLAKVVFTSTNSTFHALSGFPVTPTGWKPQPTYPFEFIQFPPAPPSASHSHSPIPPAEIETDVVIVGSGCGAGVCAKTLAEAGHRVLVVDKGYHFDAPSFPMAAGEAFFHLFDGAATVTSDDTSIIVLSGSCFGGGGTTNWSAALQTQGYVRDEWAGQRGLGFFGTQEFQGCLDRGARKLGWSAKKVPQNSGGCDHLDGYCTFGCATGEKKGPVNGWFPDAARNGARFVEGFKVERVLFDDKVKPKRAVGVVGTWTSRAKNGRLDGSDDEKVNPQIGRNLHLHPVSVLHGFFKEDIRPWEGAIITAVVNSFENLDGKGHGVKLECLTMMPCFPSQFLNWSDGVDWKLQALKYRHMNSFISLVRDRDTGYVYPDPTTGQPRVVYTPSAFDRRHAMIGLIALAKILYVQGALEIHAALPGMRPFIRDEAPPPSFSSSSYPTTSKEDLVSTVADAGATDPPFKAWLAELEAHGNKPPLATFGSAHQMGTCRMSTSEKTGVVDRRGRVWGTEGLYVSDSSVFPSASGVNPMVTNMAISDWISRNVAEDLRRDGNRLRAQL